MNEDVKRILLELGLSEEMIEKLEAAGATEGTDLDDASLIVTTAGCGIFTAKKIVKKFAPIATATETATTTTVTDVIPEGTTPSPAQVNNFANQFGIDPTMMSALMFSGFGANTGMDVDISSMIPIGTIIGSYSPKIRNMPYMVVGQIEKRLGTPIIVINENGSVNPGLTAEYVKTLEEGFQAAEDNIYYDTEGRSYEVIAVGIDAQSIYDSDPIDSSRALQQNGMGIGRINWSGVHMEVKQIIYFAVKNGELRANDETKLSWLRTNINAATTKSTLRLEFPKATMDYNESFRIGALPTLRTQLSRAPRKPETMPRRSTMIKEDRPEGGSTF